MTKERVAEIIMDKTGITKKEALELYKTLSLEITDKLLKEHTCKLPYLGILKLKRRSQRNGRNPQTGEAIVIPATNTVTFKPSKDLKVKVN